MNRLKYEHTTINDKVKPMGQEFNETTVNVVASQGAKIGFVWAAIGISSWTDAAAFLAFVLSFLALSEYLWKKILRPMLANLGVCKPARKRVKMVAVEEEEES
jgi:hypothetical protein